MITGLGRCAISRKSCGLRVNPKSNISSVNIGNTINIVFIVVQILVQRYKKKCIDANKNEKCARLSAFFQ
jgi:hypothetical protein